MEWNGMSSGFVEKRDPDQMDGRYEVVGWGRSNGANEGQRQRRGEREKGGRGKVRDAGGSKTRGVARFEGWSRV